MKKFILLFLNVACMVASGCSKKHPAVPSSEAVSPPEAPLPTTVPKSANQGTPDLQAINQALKAYARDKKRVPLNLDELVAAGYLAKAPLPPDGKRFAIDPKQIEVRVENYRVGF